MSVCYLSPKLSEYRRYGKIVCKYEISDFKGGEGKCHLRRLVFSESIAKNAFPSSRLNIFAPYRLVIFIKLSKSCHVCFTAAFEPIHRTNNEFTFVKYYYRMLVAIIEGCYFFLKFSLNDLHYP